MAAGDNQSDTVAATLKTPYAVLVTDDFGNGEGGVTVTWTVTTWRRLDLLHIGHRWQRHGNRYPHPGNHRGDSASDRIGERVFRLAGHVHRDGATRNPEKIGVSGRADELPLRARPSSAGHVAAQDQFSNTATSFSGVYRLSCRLRWRATGITARTRSRGGDVLRNRGGPTWVQGTSLRPAQPESAAPPAPLSISSPAAPRKCRRSRERPTDTVAATLTPIGQGERRSRQRAEWRDCELGRSLAGEGSVTRHPASTTDTNGIATATHTLGTQAGPNRIGVGHWL